MEIRNRKEYENGTNRSVYNKLRKIHLSEKGKIRCPYCGWNSGENSSDKWYGSTGGLNKNGEENIRFPSWKLYSKNKKQWQEKPSSYRIKKKKSRRKDSYITEIKFDI